jgi:hypothetical protein
VFVGALIAPMWRINAQKNGQDPLFPLKCLRMNWFFGQGFDETITREGGI